jgi:heptose-I-phosphate ethanolaminephosphotransferase
MAATRAVYLGRVLVHVAVLLLGPAALGALRMSAAARVLVFYAGLLLVLFALTELGRALTASVRTARWVRRAYAIACGLVLLIAAVHADNTAHYGALVTDSVEALFQTDLAEAFHYVLTYTSPEAFVLCAAWVGAALASLFAVPPAAVAGAPRRPVLATLGALVLAGAGAMALEVDSSLLVFREAAAYRRALRRFSASRDAVADRVLAGEVGSGFRGNVVVVIGESTGRHHLGVYGYFRDTTPKLAARRSQLALFADAIATHSHTVPSLMDALSFNERNARKAPRSVLDVITLANRADFTTAWLSNQSAVGVWNNLVSILARRARHVRYHSESGDQGPWRARYDDEMLASLEEVVALPEARKLIFVHLMATHSPYCEMIPPAFRSEDGGLFAIPMNRAVYGDALADDGAGDGEPARKLVRRLNCYDSAVRYVDSVLDGMIARLEAREEPTILVYFADHGEAPLLDTGHDSRAHSHFHIEIPLIVWMNDAYRRAHPETASSVARNVSRPVSLADLSYAIADAARISGVSEVPRRSFLSAAFEPFERTTLHGKVHYDRGHGKGDPVERARARLADVERAHGAGARAKVWAHRVNSLGAALEARELFAGIEVDVVYHPKQGEFFVHHPPQPNLGLRLGDFLRLDDGRLGYWFDWKNATTDNIDAALARLETLDGQYGLKRRAIVETGRPNARTSEIAARGWVSSYYLPTEAIRRRVERGDEAARKALAARLVDTAARHGYGAVSFDLTWLPFFDGHLRHAVTARGLRVFGWIHRTEIHQANAVEQLDPYVTDTDLDVVLVGFRSPFDL